MKQIITDIQNRLISQVPALKYIDLDWGQLDYYFPHPPVQWPCALIGITQGTFSNIAHRGQLGLLTVVISVADLRISNSSGKAPQNQKDKALAIFDIMQDVYEALQGWTGGSDYSGLIRAGYTQRQREDQVKIHQVIFTTEWKDTSAIPVPATTPATAKIKVQLKSES